METASPDLLRVVRLLPVRVADGGSRVELGDLIAGMDYAISRKAKIINLSLGGLPAPMKSTARS